MTGQIGRKEKRGWEKEGHLREHQRQLTEVVAARRSVSNFLSVNKVRTRSILFTENQKKMCSCLL
jgi:hypothetical protein